MSMMSEVFKLPLIARQVDDESFRVNDSDGNVLPQSKEFADAICQAVNQHDKLVDALGPFAKIVDDFKEVGEFQYRALLKNKMKTDVKLSDCDVAHTLVTSNDEGEK